MDLYQLLKQDPQKAKRLFERVGHASDGPAKSRQRLLGELIKDFALHSDLEERHFYPALMRHDEMVELVQEAIAEHDDVKTLLEALADLDPDDEGWTEQLAEVQVNIESHIEEEETVIFPLAQKLLEGEAEDIAEAIERDKVAAKSS